MKGNRKSPPKPAWTVLVSRMLDKIRVNALPENRPLSRAGIIGSRISLWLTFCPEDVRAHIERVPPLVDIPKKLPDGMTEKQYREMVLDYPEGDGMSIMQILADRIAHGDRKFMEDFSKELKPLNRRNDNRAELLLALVRSPKEIEAAQKPAEIIQIITRNNPGIQFDESNLRAILRELGLPLKVKTGRG